MIRVELPAHLRALAKISGDVHLELDGVATLRAVLDAIERQYPVLRGTIRDRETHVRRPYVRFFACRGDLSHAPVDAPLPPEVVCGAEPLLIVGAMAGG